jgi:hypothetical protein
MGYRIYRNEVKCLVLGLPQNINSKSNPLKCENTINFLTQEMYGNFIF